MTFKPVENPVATVTLSKPIQYLGETIHVVAIRKPTGGDLLRIGNPVKHVPGSPDIEFHDGRAIEMLSALSGIAIAGSLEHAEPADLIECFWGFARFFLPGLSKKPVEQPAN